MSLSVLIDGVERADITRTESLRITNRAGDDLAAGIGELILDDIAGTLVDDGNPPAVKKTWSVVEDETASPTVLGFGRIGDFETARHDANSYADRQVDWKLILEGPSIELSGFDVHGQARPAETDWERFQWVADTYLNGSPRATTVLDATTYAPNTNTVTMEAKTYNQSDVVDVIRDCMEQADKICFVTVDGEIFYDQKDSTAYTSSISISDRIGDVNQTTVFEPIWDQGPALTSEGHTYASRLRMTYGNQQSVLVGPDASEADHDYWVGRTSSSDPLTVTSATAIANGELAFRAKGVRTYSLSLLLANDQVDLIKHGQRIQIKARAAVDVDNAYEYRRIAQLQWEKESSEFYWAHLQLDQPLTAHSKNTRGQPSTGPSTGAPGGGCIDTFSRTVLAGAWGAGEWGASWNLDLDIGIGAGDPELAKTRFSVDSAYGLYDYNEVVGEPSDTSADAEVSLPWTLPATVEFRGQIRDHGAYAQLRDLSWLFCAFPSDLSGNFTRLMDWGFGAYTIIYFASPGNPNPTAATWEAWLCTDTSTVNNQYGPDYATDPGPDCTLINSWEVEMSTISGKYCGMGPDVIVDPSLRVSSPTSAFGGSLEITATTVSAKAWGPSGLSPVETISDTTAAPTSLVFSPNRGLDLVVAVDVVITSGNCAGVSPYFALLDDPRFGAIPTEYDLGVGDGSTTVYFVSPAPYVPGSLRVWVDGLEQTAAITESDPDTGEFTFSFAPEATEQIRVWYQNG